MATALKSLRMTPFLYHGLASTRHAAAVSVRTSVRVEQSRSYSDPKRPNPYLHMLSPDPEVIQNYTAPSFRDEVIARLGDLSNGRIGKEVMVTAADGSKVPWKKDAEYRKHSPVYKLVDDDVVEEEIEKANRTLKASSQSQGIYSTPLPEPTPSQVLSQDPEAGNKRFTFVFTDISKGADDHTRNILLREPDGTLRTALPNERERYNQIFFPKLNKKLKLPLVFEEDNMKVALEENRHCDLLDIICKLKSSDHADFRKVHQRVHKDVDERQIYNVLQDTVHWEGLTEYILFKTDGQSFISTLLHGNRLEDAASMCQLFLSSEEQEFANSTPQETIKAYLADRKTGPVHQAFQKFLS